MTLGVSQTSPPGGELSRDVAALIRGGATTVVVAVPAPVAAPERLLALGESSAFVWRPPTGAAFAGVGTCRHVSATGDGRFSAVEDAARRLFAGVKTAGAPGAPAPRLFGGFSFAVGSASATPWDPFGDASFTLPRLGYAVHGDRAWLSLAVRSDEAASRHVLERHLGLLPRAVDVLGQGASSSASLAASDAVTVGPVEWRAAVDSIRGEISAGRAEKIVAARRAVHGLAGTVDVEALVGRLSGGSPSCTCFAFVRGGTAFVGASPETLVALSGRAATTEALAGSLAPHHDPSSLLDSEKDRAEHAYVVREIVESLRTFASRVTHAPTPEIRRLPNVVHLRTPVRAELDEPVHLLRLAAALHPTPAVAGVPRGRALDWIAAHEPTPRGWYAGPVGWLDAAGDGELVVALRSGLLTATEAHLYAGAGIVAASEADREYAETELKLDALRAALGARG